MRIVPVRSSGSEIYTYFYESDPEATAENTLPLFTQIAINAMPGKLIGSSFHESGG
jgi:hypothetical protein